jgi:hypothetical protein
MPHVNRIQVLEQRARQNTNSAIMLMSGYDKFLDAAEQVAKTLGLQLLGVLYNPFALLT